MAVVEIRKYVRNFQHISPKVKKVKARPNRTIYLIGKRLFDIVVSFLVITLVLSWLIPILAILIRLDSRGPVFFVQNRVGFLGCSFRCYKLRTMVVNDDADSKQASNNDITDYTSWEILESYQSG